MRQFSAELIKIQKIGDTQTPKHNAYPKDGIYCHHLRIKLYHNLSSEARLNPPSKTRRGS